MAWIKGSAVDYEDLISQIIAYVTDKKIHADDAWELMRNDPWPRGTIFKCPGLIGEDHFYIGLMPLNVEKGKTYREWFMDKKNISTNFVWSEKGLNLYQQFTVSGDTVAITIDDKRKYFSFSNLEIFTYSAKVMYLGVFKQYQDGLDWHEQPGAIDFSNTPMMPVEYHIDGQTYPIEWQPPMFPGAGYPALSMDANGPVADYFNFYLVKNKRSLIIVTNNSGYWDSSYVGFFEPYAGNTEYSFPAVILGSTGYTSVGDTRYILNPVIGPQFDYRPDNWDLSHGIAPYSSSPIDNERAITQSMVMLPNGKWKSFANYVQSMSSISFEHGQGYYYVRNEPVRPNAIKHFIHPTEADIYQLNNVYDKNEIDTDKSTYKLESIEFIEASDLEKKNIMGKVPNLYVPSTPIIKYGEVLINGKHHLVLPNVWENRKFYLKYHVAHCKYYNPDELLKDDRRIETLSKMMNLVIELEE